MDASKLLDLFGHSIYHPEIDKAFKLFGVEVKDKSKLDRYDSLKSKTCGITFTFWYKGFYETQIRKPQSVFKPTNEDEVLLYEMTFTRKINSNYIMPFGLKFSDTSEEVVNKIGQKPFSKSKNIEDEPTWTFYNDLFEIMPVFDKNLRLNWLRIWGLNTSDKKKIELKNSLKAQNKNINPNNIETLLSLKKLKPTESWQKRMKEGDSIFTNSNIKESAELLDSFINNLAEAAKTKKAETVFSKVKNVVTAFNKLNKKHDNFIETTEREELVEFIEQATKATGFNIDGVDITEDYRQW